MFIVRGIEHYQILRVKAEKKDFTRKLNYLNLLKINVIDELNYMHQHKRDFDTSSYCNLLLKIEYDIKEAKRRFSNNN